MNFLLSFCLLALPITFKDDSGSDPGSDDGDAAVGQLNFTNEDIEAFLGKFRKN